MQEEVHLVRDETLDELAVVDHELAALVARRRDLVDRVVGCNRALTGTGVIYDDRGRRVWQARTHESIPFEDPIPAPAGDVPPATPAAIRERGVSMIRSIGPLSVAELHRLLAFEGLRIDGYAPKVIANALRSAERCGDVVRAGRGIYAAGD